MAKIGDVFVGRIAPTNAAGAPAPVFNVVYFEDGDSYDVSVSPDGVATFVAKSSGTGNSARAEAVSKGGVQLSEVRALPDVEAPPVDEEATSLNFTVDPA